ncbi:NUDIX hydrolase [Labedaea rhizosphaerae]|uniref:8-oxo-dGTP diphosphatase n=1 Tax=Labedaea rhizosphaerae TaxID=598644 RepID=A0A4R6SED5_LABRH|nr:NUDIX hydrolase [Labedaea rhizosphaerae]TDP97495.1 8-oxo-dGTP diphosphatase [Labedaea rhizosphaerae]
MPAEIVAAGAVLWRPGGEIALVHRPRYDDWSLPKGKVEPGESLPAAVRREVHEETGFACVLGRSLGQVGYRIGRDYKTVDYFAARAGDGEFAPNKEVDELRWLPVPDALALLTYQRDRGVVRWFAADPPTVATVLLVRHAKAGKREEWSAPDDLRPLSPAGVEQARQLRELLPHFGPDRVHSAPPVRCRSTVQAVADDLGVPVVDEPRLSENGYWANEDRGRERFLRIVAAGGTPVVCSQGGVIPDLVSALAEEGEVRLPSTRTKKGSMWLLSFTEGQRLFAADYFPSPDGLPVIDTSG